MFPDKQVISRLTHGCFGARAVCRDTVFFHDIAVIKKNVRQLIENFGRYHLSRISIFTEFKSLPDRIQGFEPVFLSDFKNLHRHIV